MILLLFMTTERGIPMNYELRNLTADDMFPMFQILSKVGIKEFKGCFNTPEIRALVEGKTSEKDLNSVGLMVTIEAAGILMANLPKAKDDIYQLLSGLSGLKVKEIAALPMADFAQMIIDVIQKEEFKDFFQVVIKLFK